MSPEAIHWFGASKATQPDGSPLVLYHGTGWDFVPDTGLWFTPDPGMASWYALGRAADFAAEAAPNIIPVILRLEDPLEIDASGAPYDAVPFDGGIWLTDDLAREALARGKDGLLLRNVCDGDNRLGDVYFSPRPEQFMSLFVAHAFQNIHDAAPARRPERMRA